MENINTLRSNLADVKKTRLLKKASSLINYNALLRIIEDSISTVPDELLKFSENGIVAIDSNQTKLEISMLESEKEKELSLKKTEQETERLILATRVEDRLNLFYSKTVGSLEKSYQTTNIMYKMDSNEDVKGIEIRKTSCNTENGSGQSEKTIYTIDPLEPTNIVLSTVLSQYSNSFQNKSSDTKYYQIQLTEGLNSSNIISLNLENLSKSEITCEDYDMKKSLMNPKIIPIGSKRK